MPTSVFKFSPLTHDPPKVVVYSRLGLWDETKGRWRMEGEEQVIYSTYVHGPLYIVVVLINLWIFGQVSPLIGSMTRSVG